MGAAWFSVLYPYQVTSCNHETSYANPMDQPRRILLAGLAKSGTTALYFRIKNSMPMDTQGFFEPREFSVFDEIRRTHLPLIAKVLTPLPDEFKPHLHEFFSHRVLIVRDPRDVVVSSLLYNSAYTYLWRYPLEQIRVSLSLLRRKEQDSASVSLLSLFSTLRDDFTCSEFAAFASRMLAAVAELAEPQFGFFVVTYEDMVAGRLAALERYLGFPLTGKDDIDQEFRRVERTKSSGLWKDWFIAEDVAYFRPLLDTFLRRFGYDADDWSPSPRPNILPVHCSEYVRRVLNERRQGEALEPVEA